MLLLLERSLLLLSLTRRIILHQITVFPRAIRHILWFHRIFDIESWHFKWHCLFKKEFNFPISYFNKQYIVVSNIGTRKFEDKRMTNRSHFGGSCYNIDCIGKQRYVHNHVAPPCHFVLRVRYIRSKGWGEGRRKKTAMIYYRPQILFLLCARQLRLRSSIFFPFTAHRATFPQLPLSFFLHPLCSAPSLKVTDCLLYYPLVSIFTLLSSVLVSIVPEANSFGHNTSWRTIILKYY